ncbi:MAG TPA: hypothetical protein DG753_10790 [Clostridium sp.]|nr:hypothetical protein [Clostridium sp.]
MSFSFGEGNIILNAINKYINLNTDKENNQDDLNVGKIIGIISKIIKEEGFNINNQKTKFLRKNNRQSITGIVINNDEVAVPKQWVKNLRAAIHNASKLKECGLNIPYDVQNEIKGMSSWLACVNREKYSTIIAQCENLLK